MIVTIIIIIITIIVITHRQQRGVVLDERDSLLELGNGPFFSTFPMFVPSLSW